MRSEAEAVGGPLLTARTIPLLLLALLGLGLMGWRFYAGLGAVTGLNDGYPWGLWIALDVVTGTAIGCGGYAVVLLAYIFNRGRLHPLVRPALLTSLLGYSMAALAIMVDVGRPWNLYKVLVPFFWNLNSVLLEVALCVMAYVVVLAIELAPAVLERGGRSERPLVRRLSQATLPVLERLAVIVIALGLLLPTMHQSSLGSVMLIAGPKLHGLWHTAWLPLLFLLSCVNMGYAAVILESSLSRRAFSRPQEAGLLSQLALPIVAINVAFVGLRVADIVAQGRLGLVTAGDSMSLLFLAETALFLAPVFMLLSGRARRDQGNLFRASMLLLAAAVLYRFDTYLVAFDPGGGWTYFPTVPELGISIGIVALEVLIYVWFVRRFPILGSAGAGVRATSAAPAAAQS